MSSYIEDTIHPVTGEIKPATWIDNYFGRHRYGVRFEGEDHVYRRHEVRVPEPALKEDGDG